MDIIPIDESGRNQPNPEPQPPKISKLADVSPDAQIGDDCEIGPYCVIGPKVTIGRGTKLLNSVSVLGKVKIGEYNKISPGAVIGGEPQDLSYKGSETRVIIGDRNVIRENVTINRASEKEEGVTRVGSDGFFMACSHIAHDCIIADHVILGQGSMLGGHVHVHHHATISGCVAVVHYVSVGSYVFIGGSSRCLQDVTPFMLTDGNPARPRCVNLVGLKRNNIPRETISALTETYKLLYRSRVGLENTREILQNKGLVSEKIDYCLSFVEESQQGRHGRGRERRKAA